MCYECGYPRFSALAPVAWVCLWVSPWGSMPRHLWTERSLPECGVSIAVLGGVPLTNEGGQGLPLRLSHTPGEKAPGPAGNRESASTGLACKERLSPQPPWRPSCEISSFEHGWLISEVCKCPNAMQALVRAAQSTAQCTQVTQRQKPGVTWCRVDFLTGPVSQGPRPRCQLRAITLQS